MDGVTEAPLVAPGASSLSLISLFLQADLIVKAVIIGLLIASVWSWAIIIDKSILYSKMRKSMDRFVRAAVYVNGLPKPADRDEGAAFIMSVMRNVSVPFGKGEPDRPNISPTIFRTVIDLTGGRYYFESTYAPNVVWIDLTKLDFSKGRSERNLQVEKNIFKLHGDVTSEFQDAKPLVFGSKKH